MNRPAKHLTTSGNSLALVLDKPILDATGITRETPLEVSTDGSVIIISPVRDAGRTAAVRAAADAVFGRYAGVFRRLAE